MARSFRRRDLARDALVHDSGQREHVGPQVDRLETLRLLRRHVVRTADRRAEHGELLPISGGVFGAAEVEELYDISLSSAAEKQVVRLEITVNEAASVRLVEPDRNLREHAHQPLGCQY